MLGGESDLGMEVRMSKREGWQEHLMVGEFLGIWCVCDGGCGQVTVGHGEWEGIGRGDEEVCSTFTYSWRRGRGVEMGFWIEEHVGLTDCCH